MALLTGLPQIFGIKPHETGTSQEHPLGTQGVTSDGRKYRYAQAGATALGAGQLQIAPDVETQHEDLAVNTFAVGDKSITVTLGSTAITGNEYEEGFVNVTDATGQGIMYRIKSAPATDSSGEVIIVLEEPIVVAAEAATTVTLYRNKYRDVVISDTTQTDIPVGVPNVIFAISAYGWLQTGGPCSILVDSNDTTVGTPVTIGAGSNGAVETKNAAGEPVVGIQPAGVGADAGEYGIFELQID